MAQITIRFDRGTIDLGAASPRIDGVVFDERTQSHRIAAHRFGDLAARADAHGVTLAGDLRTTWLVRNVDLAPLGLRSYQEEALSAWTGFGKKGVVVLPTGAGKTRLAIAAIASTGLPAAVLCPTRALATAWIDELHARLAEPIGLVGDGERRVERVTVLTFESAFRHMDTFGDRFGLLVVDEAHHFASGARIEALEACAAVARLGLTATAPEPSTEGARTLEGWIGPVVYELGYRCRCDAELERFALDEEGRERVLRCEEPWGSGRTVPASCPTSTNDSSCPAADTRSSTARSST